MAAVGTHLDAAALRVDLARALPQFAEQYLELARLVVVQRRHQALVCGSIRAAAAKLGVSQPAVTKSVRSLENELGVELIHRTTLGVTPTPAGAAFAGRARVAQLELDQAREEIMARRGEAAASLNLGLTSAAMVLVATQAIVRFRQAHPLGRMHVIEGPGQTLLPLVRSGSIDVALSQRVEPSQAPGLTYRPLLSGPPGGARAQRTPAGARVRWSS